MGKRDYYSTLGLSRGATTEEIKRAYRKLARELHPDVNKSPDATRKFSEVQEAYDVLSDEAKRRKFDMFGHEAEAHGRPRPGAGGGATRQTWTGADGEAMPFDADDLGSVFDAIFGDRAGRGGRSRPGPFAVEEEEEPEQNVLRRTVTVPFETVQHGGVQQVRIEEGAAKGKARTRTIEVRVPPGVADGTQLRVRGSGSGQRGAPDLILMVRVMPHALFRRGETEETGRGLDLYLDLPITIGEATLGATMAIPTLGQAGELVIPPGTASGRKLRLKGQGLADQSGNRGDLYAVVKIVPPLGADLTEEQRRLLQKIAALGPGLRTGPHWPGHS